MGILDKLFGKKEKKGTKQKPDNGAIEALIHALKDEDEFVRRKAAESLGEIGWQPKDELERAYYLIAKYEMYELVEIGEPVVEPLIHALKDNCRTVQSAAARALG